MTAGSPLDTGCGVTVLRTVKDARATKRWRWDAKGQEWSKISYEAGAWFIPREHQVADLASLVAILDQVRRDPRAFVVRGGLTPETKEASTAAAERGDTHLIRRRKHAKGDIVPSLAEVSRRWLMIDIDNWPLPSWGDLVDDPDTAIDSAIHELLPEAFHDAECWWQLSSSAGFAAGFLKVHLFFWLDQPATNVHIKAVLKQQAPGVDRAPFSAAQPHFIADPIIEGGHDPLPRRTGWRRGLEQVVTLPELRPEVVRPRPVGTGASGRVGGVADALAFLGDGEGLDGFHEPLRLAIMRYAQRCARYGERDDDALKAELRDAMQDAPRRSDRGNLSTYDDTYLQRSIDGAFLLLAGDTEIHTMRPQHTAPGQSLEEARLALAHHVGGFMDRALQWHRLTASERSASPPEHSALAVTVGAGKTHTARSALPGYIAAAQGTGGSSEKTGSGDAVPHRVSWLVPHHRGSSEALERMRELGINAEVMRGREAIVPGTAGVDGPEDKGLPMCLNLPAVADAMAAGYDADSAACGSGKKGARACPYRDQCSYQMQKPLVKRADVVIATHDSLFHPLSKEITDGIGLVIVDESWWQKGLHPNRATRLDSFADEVLAFPVNQGQPSKGAKSFRYKVDDGKTADLNAVCLQAIDGFRRCLAADGEEAFVSRSAMVAAGLTASDCADMFKLEWERQRIGLVWPGQPEDDRRKGVAEAWGNLTLLRRAGIWEALRALLAGTATHTGRLQLATLSDKEGPYTAILLHTRSEVKAAISDLPVLLLDATLPMAMVQPYLPRLKLLADVRVAAPHMHVHQVLGGWGKTSVVPSPKASPEENRRRDHLVGELADFVLANSGGDALTITYEAIEDRFSGLPGVQTGHFNAIAGLDLFRDVRSAFIIGRPLADARAMRQDALALTGRPIPPESGRTETRGALMADGSGAAINVRTYEDPDMEAMRAAITDSEIEQAMGRVRGVCRTADNPVNLFVMADVALRVPVDRLSRWVDLRLDVIGRMQARGAVLLSPADACKAYPDLFPTPDAARMAMQRLGVGKGYFPNIPLGIIFPRGMFGKYPAKLFYRPQGRGQQTRVAWVAPWRLDNCREWLTGLLGELAVYVVENPPPPSPNAEPPARPKVPPPVDAVPVVPVAAGSEVAVWNAADGHVLDEPPDWVTRWVPDADDLRGCSGRPRHRLDVCGLVVL